MLPRMATTTRTVQPTLALQAAVSIAAAVKPQPSAAALANLRAEVLLRLIETMLRHMPPTREPSPSRDLLETLLVVLKSLPGRESEGGRKLADVLARLPPDIRPGVEKLIGNVLSAMPTRALVEVVRNPNGLEAQKLATLLTASLDAGGPPAQRLAESQQKPLALNAQQLAVVSRHGTQQVAQPVQVFGDARALQTMLKRIFDFDGGDKPRPMTAKAIETAMARQEPAVTSRLPVAENSTPRTEQGLPMPAARTIGHEQPVDATEPAMRHNGSAEDMRSTTPAVKREAMPARAQTGNTAGQALARSVLHAVARDLPPALLMPAVAHLLENLSPEEANFLRALLERPLGVMGDEAPDLAETEIADPAEHASEAGRTPEGGKARSEASRVVPALPDRLAEAEADDLLPMPQAHEAVRAALADATSDKLPVAAVLRRGVSPDEQMPGFTGMDRPETTDGVAATDKVPEGRKARSEVTPATPAFPDQMTEADDSLPMPQAREALRAALADATSDKLPVAAVLRRGVSPDEQMLGFTGMDRPETTDGVAAADRVPEGRKARSEATPATPALPDQMTEADDSLPMPQAREALRAALAESLPDRLPTATVLRRGIAPDEQVPGFTGIDRPETADEAKADRMPEGGKARSGATHTAQALPDRRTEADVLPSTPQAREALRAALVEAMPDRLPAGTTPRRGVSPDEQIPGFTGPDRPEAADQPLEADRTPEGGKARPGMMQATSSPPDRMMEQDDPQPVPQAREALPATIAETRPERLLPATVLRDGVPFAFVPYLPAEEDLEWSQTREAEKDDEDPTGDERENREGAGEEASFEDDDDEPEAADMVKRREKTAEMVGAIEPGLVFYQKLGDYWT